MEDRYDVIVIGGGFSGLAAALRCAMFDKKVALFESHSIPGGLNSYYRRGRRKFDVGLHAMTNYAPKGERRRPLGKILKQLRLPYDLLDLREQKGSSIRFPSATLRFGNDLELLNGEVESTFPGQAEGWRGLCTAIAEYPIREDDAPWSSAREFVRGFISEPLLEDMIFCPLCYYGSAWERDMDTTQFVIMFQSIFMEGFCRPAGGIRTLIDWLMERCREAGVDLCFRQPVAEILSREGKVCGVRLEKGGEVLSERVLSSMGRPETEAITPALESKAAVGSLLFVESLLSFASQPQQWGVDDSIIFRCRQDRFDYQRPSAPFDPDSSVLCFSNNFERNDLEEGLFRVTHLAGDGWPERGSEAYGALKEELLKDAEEQLADCITEPTGEAVFRDSFTPQTIEHYTRHFAGTIYGSPDKIRNGITDLEGLFLIGTDQGYLGIVGSMLSGITMANHRVLMP